MNITEKNGYVETIKENEILFLECLTNIKNSPDIDEEQIVRIFKKWQEEKELKKNVDKKEEIDLAYINLINYIKGETFARRLLLTPFLRLEYQDFKGLINLFIDAKERGSFKDLVLYWGYRCNETELKYAILIGGFAEPEIYEDLKQKSLKLSNKNIINN